MMRWAASMQQLLPVGRDASGGSRRRLIQWVMVRRRELGAVVVEPVFFRLHEIAQRQRPPESYSQP
jgi:hypothetical protein